MIRRAYGAKAGYATLIAEAYEAWEEQNAGTGRG